MNHLLRLVNDITITKLRSKLSILSCWIIYTFSFFFFSFILDATNVHETLDIQILDALASTISRSIHAGSTRRITRRKCSSFHASCYNIVTRARSADVYIGGGAFRESQRFERIELLITCSTVLEFICARLDLGIHLASRNPLSSTRCIPISRFLELYRALSLIVDRPTIDQMLNGVYIYTV